MKPVKIVQGTAVPLNRSNVDTDQIIPSDWLKRIERTGFDRGLFSQWRDEPDFVLNDPNFAGARVLISGENFGIGSSREHAVWAIQQYGFEAVISSQFGDIFFNNSTKNGLVPVLLPEEQVQALMNAVEANPELELTVDVERLTVEAPGIGLTSSFELSDVLQSRIVNGLDDIALSLTKSDQIAEFEANRPSWS